MAVQGTPYGGLLLTLTHEINVESIVLTETATATDVIRKATSRTLSEAKTATATILKRVARTLSEVKIATDTFARVLAKILVLSETVIATDILRIILNGSSTFWTHISKSVAGAWSKATKSTSTWTHQDHS